MEGAGIRPGQAPFLSWQVVNECSDIGIADVKILFGTPPTELYRTQLTIPLHSTVGESPVPFIIPTTIASTFWTVGLKPLELEVNGNGSAGGPYRATATLNVIPEPIDDTWWTWARPLTVGSWKSTYGVIGSFNNFAVTRMTVSAVSAVEHPTDVTGTAQDTTVLPLAGILGTTLMPGEPVNTAVAAWSRFQSWTWLARGTFVEVGPRSRTFSYVANFSVTDAFGNIYPMIRSSPTLVRVDVPTAKFRAFAVGTTLIASGITFLALAVVATVGGGPYGWIGGVILAAIGMGLIIAGTLLLYDADDPPVPDFRERETVLVDPRAWTIPEVDDESLHPLRTLGLLLARVASARVRAVRYRDLAWAAYLDRSESMRIRHRDEARNELETLRRLVTPVIDTANEAHDKLEQLLNEMQELPTPEKLREMTARFADELHLSDVERTVIVERLKTVDEQELRRTVEHARSDGIRTVGDIVRRIYETTASEFAEREYLR